MLYPKTVLTFCPLTWESCLNHVIAVAHRFVVELFVVFRAYFIVLRESLLQHASSNFLIGSQVSHKLVSLRHFRSIFILWDIVAWTNSPLWKRVIAWERSRAAIGYGIIWGDADRNKQEEFSAECHSVDCFSVTELQIAIRSRLLF